MNFISESVIFLVLRTMQGDTEKIIKTNRAILGYELCYSQYGTLFEAEFSISVNFLVRTLREEHVH